MAEEKKKAKLAKGRHASVIKRERQSQTHRARNKQALSRLKTAIKKVHTTPTAESLKEAIPLLAKSARKGLIHRKKASRLISRLTKSVAARV